MRQKGPDESLLAAQEASAQLIREKEREEKLSQSARARSIRNAHNGRGRTLLTAIASTQSIAPRGDI